MKHFCILLLAGLLVLGACTSSSEVEPTAVPATSETAPEPTTVSPTPTTVPTPTVTPETPLGTLNLEENQVLHGQDENALVPLLESASFFEKDLIQVIDGGEAILDFGDQMRLRLFNDTELEMVAAEIGEEVPLEVQLFLFVGGFTGNLTEEGGRAVFRTPGNVEITVLGTEYFVVYDPETEETTAGNFGGTVEVASANSQVSLEEGTYVIVPDGSPPGPPLPLPLSREEFENHARETDSPIQAASHAKVWSLEIRHEFIHDYAEHWDWADGPPKYLRSWTGQFIIEGDTIVGSGTGTIKDINLKCNNFSNPANVLEIVFTIEGNFDFDIGGQVITKEDGRPVFLFEITANNLTTNSLSEIAAIDGNCDFFAPFFLDNNTSIIEDLPLVGAEAIMIEAAPEAQAVYQLDPEPYTKYQPGENLFAYKDIYFMYPIEVLVYPGE